MEPSKSQQDSHVGHDGFYRRGEAQDGPSSNSLSSAASRTRPFAPDLRDAR